VYTISVDDELRLMTVEARFEHPINYIAARSHFARRFLDDAQNCDTGERLKSRHRTLRLPPEGLVCLSYTVNLRGAAKTARFSEVLDRSNIIVSPTLWMWRPPLDQNEEISVEFHLPDGMRVFVPWQATNNNHTHYRLTASPESGSAIAAFGSFERIVEQVADSDLTIVLLATRDSRELAPLADWVRSTAENIALTYGRFPNPNANVVLIPVRNVGWDSDAAVPYGQVVRDGGETIELMINPDRPVADFYKEWTPTHEFAHLLLPYLDRKQRWISEGFAQYYQNVLLARAGQYTAENAWQRIYAGLERGRDSAPGLSPNDAAGARERNTRMKVYWSGASLALMADVELRRRSGGAESLDRVLDRFQRCCLPSPRSWSGAELFEKFDTLLDEPLFMNLYRQYADAADFPDARPLLGQLGIKVRDGQIRFDNDAGLAAIRRAIMRTPTRPSEAVEKVTGVSAEDIRGAARLYGKAENGALYYGLGVTEHSQGSTMVMGMANLAMATGNIGFSGRGVSPLRGQNNVQGSCDVGSFPHELPGYRPVQDDEVRGSFEKHWGVEIDPEPGLRIPNMFDEAIAGRYKGMYIQGEDLAQSDPNTKHVEAALGNMECIVVQDLFLNETAKFAHVFLPGTSFLEKDGTFINAERRINRVRPVMKARQGKDEWAITQELAQAMGYPMHYDNAAQILDEIAELTPAFTNVSFEFLDRVGSVQWPCNEKAPMGTPIMHIDNFVRGKGLFVETEYVATEERANRKFPLLLTTGRILSQYNVGAQTRRTPNMIWYDEDLLEIHPSDAELRGVKDGELVSLTSRKGDITLRATITTKVQPGVVYTTFHNPETGANVVTTEYSDWATDCPEYKVTAVQVAPAQHRSDWQHGFDENAKRQGQILETAE